MASGVHGVNRLGRSFYIPFIFTEVKSFWAIWNLTSYSLAIEKAETL